MAGILGREFGEESLRIHLIDAWEPLKSGGKLTANCGVEIRKAEFPFMCDLNYGHEVGFNSLLCCRNCNSTRLAKRYVYGLVEGQETKGAVA